MKSIQALFSTLLLFLSILLVPQEGKAQKEEAESKEDLIQFSGVVVRGDSLTPVPFTRVWIANEGRGTMADAQGYFSLVTKASDTIHFRAVGYKENSFIIPDSLDKTNYSLIHAMQRDTVEKEETTVYPWPSKEEFKEAFLNADIPSDDIDRARENLARAKMRKRMENMEMGAQLNFDYEMQEYQNKVYHSGQAPPISILNPSAWAEFIKAWREGRFSDQGEE